MTEEKKTDYEKILKDLSKNYWAISTIVLAILLIATLMSGGTSGQIISAEEAGQKILSFADSQGTKVELISTKEDTSFHEVVISMQGQQVPLYVTKDGKSFTQQLIPLTRPIAPSQPSAPTPTPSTYSTEDLAKIKTFSQCLADNGVKAYGAGWCGYCKQFKEAFGGAEQIAPFYIECQNADQTPTEYASLCQEEEIRGFPTIKVNGEPYNGARTIEGLASAIDACDAPELEGNTQATPQQNTGYTSEDLTKLKTFNDCLGTKGVKIYGADWCGYTKKWAIETLGGFDTASAVYIECTENEELCSSEGITGYPTTKINGEVYDGARTVAAIAQVTGCPAPTLTGSAPAAGNAAAGCGA